MATKTKVLVIGYDQVTAEHLKRMLQNSGFKASLILSPDDAATVKLKEKDTDVVIIDAQNPNKEDILKLAAQSWITKNIPVIFVALSPDDKFLDQAKNAGAFGYVAEPYEAHTLKANIEIALAKADIEKKCKKVEEDFKKYYALAENAKVVIFVLTGNKFEYVNPAFETLTGYSAAEICNKRFTFSHIVAPEDRKILEKISTGSDKSKSKGTWFEFRIINKYREMVNVECVIVDLKWGLDTKIMGILRDITEQKRVQEITILSEEYYKGMFEHANDAMLIFSPENEIILDVNPQACKIYGYTKEEFKGLTLVKISKNVPHDKMQIEETLRKGTIHNFETLQIRKDGTEIRLEVSASVIPHKGKQAIMSINRDLADRKTIEQELQESLKRTGHSLEEFIRTITIMIEKKDPHTSGHHQRVANLAYAIAKKLDLADERAEGIKIASLIHDMGKIDIPADILTKPSELNDYEFNIIKAHPRAAYDILKNMEFPWPIADIVYQHHEKLNGSGYPVRLHEDEIMLEARILMVANVVEAIAAPRAYRQSLGIDKALEEITLNRDKFYDSKAVYACLYLFNQENYKLE